MENADNLNVKVKIHLVVPAIIMGVALVGATYIGASAALRIKAMANSLSVTGSADRVIKSDTVKWMSHLTRQVPSDQLAAGSQQITKDMDALRSYLKKNGVTDSEITVRPVTVVGVCGGQNQYNGDACPEGKPASYTLTQAIQVESDKVDAVTAVATAVSQDLLGQIVLTTDGLEYYYSKLADLKVDMLADATANAKARAERIATSTGGKLGAIQSASMGVIQITAVNSTEISDYGAYDVSTIEKKVTSVVRASFVIE